MKIAKIIANDLANGEGLRTSIFVSGCDHRCTGCHNSHLWDFEVGREYDREIQWMVLKALTANNIQRDLSILGGEPLHPTNIRELTELCQNIKMAMPEIEIMLWTGYSFEEKRFTDIMKYIDIVIDGRFDIMKRKDAPLWRGSSNQHMYKKNSKGLFELID